MVDGVFGAARTVAYQRLDSAVNRTKKAHRRHARFVAWIGREDAPKIRLQISGPLKFVLALLALIVLPQSGSYLRQGFHLSARAVPGPRPGDLFQHFVDVFQLAQRRPITIAPPPV